MRSKLHIKNAMIGDEVMALVYDRYLDNHNYYDTDLGVIRVDANTGSYVFLKLRKVILSKALSFEISKLLNKLNSEVDCVL